MKWEWDAGIKAKIVTPEEAIECSDEEIWKGWHFQYKSRGRPKKNQEEVMISDLASSQPKLQELAIWACYTHVDTAWYRLKYWTRLNFMDLAMELLGGSKENNLKFWAKRFIEIRPCTSYLACGFLISNI